ncbi:uncharacterized protein LOC34622094 [Cyclospora cayetanensis]|nr:uncharacterized protein LOC34622094 [Cyclospora cayetanensis]
MEGEATSPSADSIREEGLKAFRAGDWRGATDAWSRGLRTLEYILGKEEEFDEAKKQEFIAMHQSYLLNLSLSTLKEGRWAACIHYCDKVLQRDPTVLKALYRKSQAQQELGDFDGALTTLDEYLKVAPGSPLALSLQSQLRHMKVDHAAKEKKLLQSMFRKLEHDPRSEAAMAAPTADGSSTGGSLIRSLGDKVKGWFGSPKEEQKQEWQEQLPAVNGAFGAAAAAGAASGGNSCSTGESLPPEDLLKALSALSGNDEGLSPAASGNTAELEHLARLMAIHRRLSSGEATLGEKLLFGLRLAWFGVKHFCFRACGQLCRRRQKAQFGKSAGIFTDDGNVTEVVGSERDATAEHRDNGRSFVSRAQRRQQCRTAAAAAARRRMDQQKSTT